MSLMISSDRTPQARYVCNLEPIQPSIRQAPASQPITEPGWSDKAYDRIADAGAYLQNMGFGYQPKNARPGPAVRVLKDGDTFLGGLSQGIENYIGKDNLSRIGKLGKAGGSVLSTTLAIPNVLVSVHNDRINGVQASSATLTEIAMATGQIATMAAIGVGLAASSPILAGACVIAAGFALGKGLDFIRQRIHSEPQENSATHMLVCSKVDDLALSEKKID